MSALDMSAVMDGLAELISDEGIVENIYPWPADTVAVPCALVGYPTDIEFDLTMGRGSDRAVFPVFFMVGKTSDKSSRNALSLILADATSIKDALDGTHSFGAVRVTDCKVNEVTVGAIAYLAAVFTTEVIS